MERSLSAVPSLTSDAYPSTNTSTSVDTGLASELLITHDILDHDPQADAHDDAHAPDENNENENESDDNDTISYPCLFPILNCHETFTNLEYWKTHVLSHFRTHDPPSTARCPICPSPSSSPTSPVATTGTTFTTTPQTRAWDALLDHLATTHYQPGHSRRTPPPLRPDFELLRYLFRLRIIGEEQWKAAVQLGVVPGSPGAASRGEQSIRRRVGSADEPFWGVFSPRREREREGERGRRGVGQRGVVLGRGDGGGNGRGVVV